MSSEEQTSVSAADQQETPFTDIKEPPVEEYGGAVDDAVASNLGTSSGSGTSDESVEIHRPSSEIQNPLDAGQPSIETESDGNDENSGDEFPPFGGGLPRGRITGQVVGSKPSKPSRPK